MVLRDRKLEQRDRNFFDQKDETNLLSCYICNKYQKGAKKKKRRGREQGFSSVWFIALELHILCVWQKSLKTPRRPVTQPWRTDFMPFLLKWQRKIFFLPKKHFCMYKHIIFLLQIPWSSSCKSEFEIWVELCTTMGQKLQVFLICCIFSPYLLFFQLLKIPGR